MPKRYARELRRAVRGRLVAGENVNSLPKELGVSEATETAPSEMLEANSHCLVVERGPDRPVSFTVDSPEGKGGRT
jgi:hypothetical protein